MANPSNLDLREIDAASTWHALPISALSLASVCSLLFNNLAPPSGPVFVLEWFESQQKIFRRLRARIS